MTPRLAPVAFEDLTVPRAAEGGKSARQGKAMEDKGKGKAEEGAGRLRRRREQW